MRGAVQVCPPTPHQGTEKVILIQEQLSKNRIIIDTGMVAPLVLHGLSPHRNVTCGCRLQIAMEPSSPP